MPRFAWMTDLHLPVVPPDELARFRAELAGAEVDGWFCCGDLAEAPQVLEWLAWLEEATRAPCYFVLGNHDFYRASIKRVRAEVTAFCESHPRLVYLSVQPAITLAPGIALVGHDGWGDARLGDFDHSPVQMNDFYRIAELKRHRLPAESPTLFDRAGLKSELARLGQAAADHLRPAILAALPEHRQIIVVTHVPPVAEAVRYANRPSDPLWLPFFSCHAVGEMLVEIMREHPAHTMLVLAGHTHHQAEVDVLPNLRVVVGQAEYFRPQVAGVLDMTSD